MQLKVNGLLLAQAPSQFKVTTLDLDDADTTVRTADGTLHRDRITVKRAIDMSWGLLSWSDVSSIMQAMSGTFFEFTYPDPMEGTYLTKSFYVGNRPAPAALSKNGIVYWSGLQMTLTEQ